MRAAIVHYHLEHGGVTRVIEAASHALTATGIQHVILTGENVNGLGYLTDPGDLTAERLTENLRAAATAALGAPPDVWHFHNHSIGKNCLLPQVISRLAAAGERLVLQIHDLAEQGRPENHRLISGTRDLYPFSPRIHYAFINSRDLSLFIAAGLPPEAAALLPNPISLPTTAVAALADSVHPLLFAPVRGIRRKNLGELVLLSVLGPHGTRIAVSRAPENPKALPIHDTWRDFAAKHQLPIGFDVVDRFTPGPGEVTDFETWVSHATHFVSTSVSEGFGMTFLEAIACGKPLLGRNLPHLTADHTTHGIRAGRLYDAILVPVDWIDITILRDHLTIDLERDHRFYQRPLTGNPVGTALAAMIQDRLVDFGNLPEPLQQGVIERIADPTERMVPLIRSGDTVMPAVEWLAEALAHRSPTAKPDQLTAYSPETYQIDLTSLYGRLFDAPASAVDHVCPEAILDACFRPETFHFLLSSLRPEALPTKRFRAVICDIYGTLLIAPSGGVKPDPFADPVIREILRQAGHHPPASPSSELHAAVIRHHTAAGVPFPEIDLRILWREVLSLEADADITALVQEIENTWHPAKRMPGAEKFIQRLSRSGLSLGLLSNAQCNSLSSLGGIADLFAPELTVLSYQHGIAKPSAELFQTMVDRLAGRGISPEETLYIGNDPLHDMVPGSAVGFRTAHFIGHAESLRPGECMPDITFENWIELNAAFG